MKRQVGSVQKCVLSVLLSSAAWAIPGMQALAADQLPVKAPAAVEADTLLVVARRDGCWRTLLSQQSAKERLKLSRPEQPGQILRISGPATGTVSETSGCQPEAETAFIRLTSAARISAIANDQYYLISKRQKPASTTSISSGTRPLTSTAPAR